MTRRDQLGDECRLDRDLCAGQERRRLRVELAPEAEHRGREAQRLGEVGQRRNADAAADEYRTFDVESKTLAERPEDVDRVAAAEPAERLGSRPDRVDQEGKLAGGCETERERPRQEPARRLEHEELSGDPRFE